MWALTIGRNPRMIPGTSEILLRYELRRPIAEELRSRAPLAFAPVVVAVLLWW